MSRQLSLEEVNKKLDAGETITLSSGMVRVAAADFKFESRNVQAVTFLPVREGKHPGVLLIPGYGRTARDQISLGSRLAAAGFACMSISQPGFGKSEGKADFVGPMTMRTVDSAFERLKVLPSVDPAKLGVFGYSRGAMAASLLATRRTDLKGVVLGAGVYDFKKAYDEATLEGIKKNMEDEAGLSDAAVKERSSILAMEKLMCPALLLHGEKDENVQVGQSKALAARLKELGKPHELILYPDAPHGLPMAEVGGKTIEFFKRVLK